MRDVWISAAIGAVGFVVSMIGIFVTHDCLVFGAAFAVAAQGVIFLRREIQFERRRLARSSSVTSQ